MNFESEVYEGIKRLITANGMSQSDLERGAGVTQSSRSLEEAAALPHGVALKRDPGLGAAARSLGLGQCGEADAVLLAPGIQTDGTAVVRG